MMTYKEAIDIVKQLIADKGRGFDWRSYKRFRYDVSEGAKHLAVKLLDDPNHSKIADDLREAIGIELNCDVRRDYVYRVLALVLDDDDMGNHITLNALLAAKNYRMRALGMAY